MDRVTLQQHIAAKFTEVTFAENKQYAEAIIPVERLYEFCDWFKNDMSLRFDYLIDLTAVDWKDHFMLVGHITSTSFRHTMVFKARIERENPMAISLSGIWKTAEYQEREIFDLFGIKFKNHPDLRRLFLEDDYGFPLRKDFTDESRMIVK